MKKRYIIITLFLFFIFEGTVFRLISPDFYGSIISLFPRFVLVLIILISIFRNRKYGLFLGIGFGLLYDIVYGNVIGVYMVGMAGVGYFSGWLIQFLHPTLLVYLLIEFVGLFLFELFLYSMLRLYKLTYLPLDTAIVTLILPSIIFNLVFAIFIYIPAHYLIEKKGISD